MARILSLQQQWAMEAFSGLQNMIVPSFTVDRTGLSEAGIRRDARRSIEHGFFSTICACDAGLTLEENRRFVEIVADEAGDEIMVGVSLFLDSEEDIMDLAEHAGSVGCRLGMLGFPPLFNPQTQDDVYEYGRRICEGSRLSFILPAHPERVDFTHLHPRGVALNAYERLAEIDNVVAVLVQTTEPGLISDCFGRFSGKLAVASFFFGLMPTLVKNWGMRWAGAWMYESLQTPEQPYAVEFLDLLKRARYEQAMKLYWRLAPGLSTFWRNIESFRTGGIDHFYMRKFYQWCTGGNGGLPREPQMYLLQRQRDDIRQAYRAMGIRPTPDDDENFMFGRSNYAQVTD